VAARRHRADRQRFDRVTAMMNTKSLRTTKLYDRTADVITLAFQC